MRVCIVQWFLDKNDHIGVITIWDNVDSARKAICDDILKSIPAIHTSQINTNGTYDVISDYITDGKYALAIEEWNMIMMDNQVSVWERDMWTYANGNAVMVKCVQGLNIKGSMCRKCNTYNEYAISDKGNGTHVCYSCKV